MAFLDRSQIVQTDARAPSARGKELFAGILVVAPTLGVKSVKELIALAKQKPKAKRKNPAAVQRYRYPPNVPFIQMFQDPFGGFLGLAGALFGMIQPRFDADVWICDPCSIRIDAKPGAAPLHFCPKCRGPLRLIGAHAPTVDPGPKCIEAEYEDVTHKRLPAPEKK
jgi:hypothetical protein